MERTSLYTIGHSTRTLEQFVEIVRSFEVEMIVDVRTCLLYTSDAADE